MVDGQLEIQPLPEDTLLEAALQRRNNASLFQDLLREIFGEGTTWVLKKSAASVDAVQREPAEPDPRKEAMKDASEDPTVKAVLDIFGGRIQSVQ